MANSEAGEMIGGAYPTKHKKVNTNNIVFQSKSHSLAQLNLSANLIDNPIDVSAFK